MSTFEAAAVAAGSVSVEAVLSEAAEVASRFAPLPPSAGGLLAHPRGTALRPFGPLKWLCRLPKTCVRVRERRGRATVLDDVKEEVLDVTLCRETPQRMSVRRLQTGRTRRAFGDGLTWLRTAPHCGGAAKQTTCDDMVSVCQTAARTVWTEEPGGAVEQSLVRVLVRLVDTLGRHNYAHRSWPPRVLAVRFQVLRLGPTRFACVMVERQAGASRERTAFSNSPPQTSTSARSAHASVCASGSTTSGASGAMRLRGVPAAPGGSVPRRPGCHFGQCARHRACVWHTCKRPANDSRTRVNHVPIGAGPRRFAVAIAAPGRTHWPRCAGWARGAIATPAERDAQDETDRRHSPDMPAGQTARLPHRPPFALAYALQVSRHERSPRSMVASPPDSAAFAAGPVASTIYKPCVPARKRTASDPPLVASCQNHARGSSSLAESHIAARDRINKRLQQCTTRLSRLRYLPPRPRGPSRDH